jgi:hypothetical protein
MNKMLPSISRGALRVQVLVLSVVCAFSIYWLRGVNVLLPILNVNEDLPTFPNKLHVLQGQFQLDVLKDGTNANRSSDYHPDDLDHASSVTVTSTASASATGGGLSYDYLLHEPTHAFGDLSNMKCVCGCTDVEIRKKLTLVKCSFFEGTVRVCIFQKPLFYASPAIILSNNKSSATPLLMAICTEHESYRGILSNAGRWWKGHEAFGIKFDHVSNNRIAGFSSEEACDGGDGGKCRVPESFVWGGGRSSKSTGSTSNGWVPKTQNRSEWIEWSSIGDAPQARPNGAKSTTEVSLAYLDSGDCNFPSGPPAEISINPWHCKAVWTNYMVLSGIFERQPELLGRQEFSRTQSWVFSLAGAMHYFDYGLRYGPMVGWYEMTTAFGGFDSSFREPRKADTRMSLQGRFQIAIPNVPPAESMVWRRAIPETNEPSEVIQDLRRRLSASITRDLLVKEEHPLFKLPEKFPNNVRAVLPSDAIKKAAALQSLELEYVRWGHVAAGTGKADWVPRVVPKLTILLCRSQFSSPVHKQSCSRCLTNIDDLAKRLADDLGLFVLIVRPAAILPEAIQVYLFLVAHCVIGMHGGAWGSALVMADGQAAVEILPAGTNAHARHIVTTGGAIYESSLCVDCARSQTNSGSANLDDVLIKASKVLEAR